MNACIADPTPRSAVDGFAEEGRRFCVRSEMTPTQFGVIGRDRQPGLLYLKISHDFVVAASFPYTGENERIHSKDRLLRLSSATVNIDGLVYEVPIFDQKLLEPITVRRKGVEAIRSLQLNHQSDRRKKRRRLIPTSGSVEVHSWMKSE